MVPCTQTYWSINVYLIRYYMYFNQKDMDTQKNIQPANMLPNQITYIIITYIQLQHSIHMQQKTIKEKRYNKDQSEMQNNFIAE